jgi:hypothetical protein
MIVMKKILIVFFITLSNIVSINAQQTVGGVTLPKKIMIGGTVLDLNGAGVREKLWIDMYACGLYVLKKSNDENVIINNNEHTAIKIQIISSLITSKKMAAAVEEGFKKSTDGKTKSIRKRINQFKEVFAEEEIKQGDVYDIIYVPKKGTVIFKNGKLKPIIEGLDFKKALIGIWLGDQPADKELKKNLLNKK